jgi:hypothetical protein
MRLKGIGFLLLVILIPCTLCRPLEADTAGKPEETKAVVVTTGFHILDISYLDIKDQIFTAHFFFWLRYPGDKAFGEFEFTNGDIHFKKELMRRKVGTDNYVCYRIKGSFHQEFSFRHYPFDRQELKIKLRHPLFQSDKVIYHADYSSYEKSQKEKKYWGISPDLKIEEWSVLGASHATETFTYFSNFGDPLHKTGKQSYSQLTFSVHVDRLFAPYFYKIIVPLTVIVGMAYLVFYIPAKDLETATELGMTALLTCVAFHMTTASGLPEVGYLVTSDRFFLLSYILIFSSLVETVVTYNMDLRGRGKAADKLEKWCAILFPVIYGAGVLYLLLKSVFHFSIGEFLSRIF